MSDDPDLERAYALDGPDANRALYADWAETYDADFAAGMDYRSPAVVAQAYATLGIHGPVLDVGAGTGLVAEELAKQGPFDIDATDLSEDMLAVAARKGVYRLLFQSDLTQRLEVRDAHYSGVISAGTFTHGHVGPEAIGEVLRVLRPGGAAVLTVNAEHWHSHGFADALEHMSDRIEKTIRTEFDLYGPKAKGPHAKDRGILLTLVAA